MTPEELEQFKRRLTALAEEIKIILSQSDPADESIVPDSAIGRITRMEAIQAQSMSAEGKRRQEARLGKIDRALDSLLARTERVFAVGMRSPADAWKSYLKPGCA